MTWKQRYSRMKKHYDWTDRTIADFIGNSSGSVKTVTSREIPAWLKLAIIIFETENKLEN